MLRSIVRVTTLAIALLCAVAMPAGLVAPGTAATKTSLRQLGLPEGLQLGLRDPEHGASALRRSVPARYRYHYLSGGANTGRGWTTWAEGGGSFVTGYVQDSLRNGFVPVFSLYQLQESLPGRDAAQEPDRVRINLNDPQAMRAWFADLRLFFTRAAAFGDSPIVLHVEPDLWGYTQPPAMTSAGSPRRWPRPPSPSWPGCPTASPGSRRPSCACATRARPTSCSATS